MTEAGHCHHLDSLPHISLSIQVYQGPSLIPSILIMSQVLGIIDHFWRHNPNMPMSRHSNEPVNNSGFVLGEKILLFYIFCSSAVLGI